MRRRKRRRTFEYSGNRKQTVKERDSRELKGTQSIRRKAFNWRCVSGALFHLPCILHTQTHGRPRKTHIVNSWEERNCNARNRTLNLFFVFFLSFFLLLLLPCSSFLPTFSGLFFYSFFPSVSGYRCFLFSSVFFFLYFTSSFLFSFLSCLSCISCLFPALHPPARVFPSSFIRYFLFISFCVGDFPPFLFYCLACYFIFFLFYHRAPFSASIFSIIFFNSSFTAFLLELLFSHLFYYFLIFVFFFHSCV